MADEMHYIGGAERVPVRLRRSSRARRMSLRVSHLKGEVTLTLPLHLAAAEGLRFARTKLDWIRHHMMRAERPMALQPGAVLQIRGEDCVLHAAPNRKTASREGNVIHVPAADTGKRLEAWLRAEARREVARQAERYAAKLGKPYSQLAIADTKSRWGSCSSRGRIMISFRLIMAPPEVLNYVVAHEVAHLAEMNHSTRFWAVCQRLYGDYEAPRAWLKTHGPSLHRYRFEL